MLKLLFHIERLAQNRGEVVTVQSGPLGTAVHAHGKGEEPSEQNWTAWFMELSDSCTCNEK